MATFRLMPTFAPPEIVRPLPDAPPSYPRSYRFDFDRGEFVLDGAGRPVEVDGHTAWVQWCVKAVLTPRYHHAIYSHRHGTEFESVPNNNRPVAEAYVAATIRDALLADPRTAAVDNFAFDWSGDALRVSFRVAPRVGPTTEVSVALST